ncbi:MAG: hypothetical protein ACLFPM_02245, partial [Candidatus Izemoplasmatales bacterium]
MKALRTKVILSGIVLVFAFIATIGTTFAWFTISETVAVDGINLQVTSSDNLLIRVDTGADSDTTDGYSSDAVTTISNYQSSLTLTDITNVPKYADIENWRMSPVTAINDGYGSIDAKTLLTIDDTYATRNLSNSTLKNSDSGGYIELHFWLYSQASETRPVELVSTSISPNTEESQQLQDVADAVRFGIWMNNGTSAGDAFIYGNDTEFGFEFVSGQAGYSETELFNALSDTGLNINETDSFTPMIDGEGELLDTVSGYENVLQLSVDDDHPQDIYDIEPGVPTLVTVRIFIEGFDAQA